MLILLEIFGVGVLWVLVSRFAPENLRGRLTSVLKAWLTVRAFWLLLGHEIKLEDGSTEVAWRLIQHQLNQIQAGTFWTFVAIATSIKLVGMLSSMYRWILVLRGQGIELPFRHIFGSFLIGRFIGTFLPSTAGLDGYTLYDASRFSGKTVEVTAAKFLEKICGFSGVFMTFLVSAPFGLAIFGENATLFAAISIPMALGVIGALLLILFKPALVQWVLFKLPIPGKASLSGIVTRIANAAAAYRDKKMLVVMVLFCSFLVHFTTAVMYYFTALAIGAVGADFWHITFGSSIQIFATVISPFTIAGEGIREAAQLVLLGHMIGAAPAIVSAALGFWAAEAPTMLGVFFWWGRKADYTPSYCLVNGEQVDYAEAAKAAASLETQEERRAREAHGITLDVPTLRERILSGIGLGFGSGVLAGILIGVAEAIVIAQGGFGDEAQVMWYGGVMYALFLGGLGAAGGAALGTLPMQRDEIRAWTPTLGFIATLVPLGLAITVFRLKRDVYLEQMPPVAVLLGVVALAGIVAVAVLIFGRRFFLTNAGRIVSPAIACGALVAYTIIGAIAAAVLSTGKTATSAAGIPPELQDRPNVILVMVDTLRADHLECYGGEVARTPNICSLVEDGGSAFNGFSHASWTKPATASLLTSLLPSTHRAGSKPAVLSPEVDLVAEVFQSHGYTTGGIVSNINLAPSFGFDQGYDHYEFLGPEYLFGAEESSSKLILYNILRAVWFKAQQKLSPGMHYWDFYQDSEVVNAHAFDWLDEHEKDRFFLFLHYMDPHDPYFEHPYDGKGIARVTNQHPDASLAKEMRRLYVGEIEYLDRNFGKLLERLKQAGIYDDTVIALVSDHGEEFFEHGGWWHGLTLYEEQIHVPLLIKWARSHPPLTKDATTGVARLIDVAPTLIKLAGASVPATMQGVDLRADPASRTEKDRQAFSEEDHEGNVLWSLRTATMKLIAANPGNPRGLPERELFAIDRDPNEKQPLEGGQYAGIAHELERHADLQRQMAEGKAVADAGEAEMTFAECEQLRMLGYVDDCSHLAQ